MQFRESVSPAVVGVRRRGGADQHPGRRSHHHLAVVGLRYPWVLVTRMVSRARGRRAAAILRTL